MVLYAFFACQSIRLPQWSPPGELRKLVHNTSYLLFFIENFILYVTRRIGESALHNDCDGEERWWTKILLFSTCQQWMLYRCILISTVYNAKHASQSISTFNNKNKRHTQYVLNSYETIIADARDSTFLPNVRRFIKRFFLPQCQCGLNPVVGYTIHKCIFHKSVHTKHNIFYSKIKTIVHLLAL